ncbi:MAG: hypothetical protein L0220_31850 [Acidobacteria bacterium]|nr:hypothetical protein [Acidobacteriota bacterium]
MGLTDEDYRKAADELGYEVSVIKAVADVDTSNDPHLPDGRQLIGINT